MNSNGVPDDPWARINSKLDEALEKTNNLHVAINSLPFTKEEKNVIRLWPWLNSLSLIAVAISCFSFVALVFIITLIISAQYSMDIVIHNIVQEDLNKN
jgi:hypothetical protein